MVYANHSLVNIFKYNLILIFRCDPIKCMEVKSEFSPPVISLQPNHNTN